MEWPPSKAVEVQKEEMIGRTATVIKHEEILAKFSGISFEITGQGGIYTLTLTSAQDGVSIDSEKIVSPQNHVRYMI